VAKESVQKKLSRVRAPGVKLTYDRDVGGVIEQRELPFIIGVLADFSGANERARLKDRHFITIEWSNFNDVLASMRPKACFKLRDLVGGGEFDIELTFSTIEDFAAEKVIERLAPLLVLRQSESPETRDMVGPHLDSLLHAPEFQALESTWRGLWYLLSQTEADSQLKIKLLDVTKQELASDLQRASTFDESVLFKKVYEQPYGVQDGEPFGLFIGDYTFTQRPEDVELLAEIASVASACCAPFIAAAGAEMFCVESLADLERIRSLHRLFQSGTYARWNSFRESYCSRYVGLALPRFLLRSPYGVRPGISGHFQYEEDITSDASLVWGNPAYAFGACVANSFSRHRWCAPRGPESGGLVEGIVPIVREFGVDKQKLNSGIEMLIADRREKEVSDLGFLPLIQQKDSDHVAFFSAPSCAKPLFYGNAEANANSRLSCQLQYMLTASRFMHYIKVMTREHGKLKGFRSRGELENFLNDWISKYVLLDDSGSLDMKARFPLREARIEVAETVDRPGVYTAVAFLRPHFQLDELSVSLRLVTTLPM
jgi:type VI secretion system protein ImpC